MGGEGSIQSMITMLRNNRQLLRKKSIFKRDRTFLNTKKEYYKAAQGYIDLKKASKEELLVIRKKIIKQRRLENVIAWSIVLAIMIPIIGFGIYASTKINHENKEKIEDIKETYLEDNINEFYYLIEEGDKWIEKKNWNNAIYRYTQAVELFPDDFEANYRLALAYSYDCRYNNKYCEDGAKLTDRLQEFYPENLDLQKLKAVFDE